ncbi:hypothetical protein LH464_04300 [Neorhizobium sp. T786]|uniref:hypothetical protein n=1 Tax=Pseudorhizobium xiangyangii TaxID=2883104 RepID=UPI001CFFB29D|nr:hypothetical protein [Neorhizobium xiangyangii]MCB5201699.1 hypothetical protein [Neorhizobium xiangyangii]
MRVFVGMETSGVVRRAFAAKGCEVISCDLLPSQDGADVSMPVAINGGGHIQGDIFDVLDRLESLGWMPDLGIFHPDCTYLTASAEWAYADPDFAKYPGVGYHQNVEPGTLTGAVRREAREEAVEMVRRIWRLKIRRKCVENPVGYLSTAWRKPTQIIQPNRYGDDASKKTCLWLLNVPALIPTKTVRGRFVKKEGHLTRFVERWDNQTDNGQNRLSQTDDRWQKRADTYPGIAAAMVDQWLNPFQGALFDAVDVDDLQIMRKTA